MSDPLAFNLSWPAPPFLVNSNDVSGHWSKWAKHTKEWRDRGWWTAKSARIPALTETVWLVRGFVPDHLYDPGADYLTFKAVQDGICKAAGMDDDAKTVASITLYPPMLGKPEFTVRLEGWSVS